MRIVLLFPPQPQRPTREGKEHSLELHSSLLPANDFAIDSVAVVYTIKINVKMISRIVSDDGMPAVAGRIRD
jgi:hypothetical protein